MNQADRSLKRRLIPIVWLAVQPTPYNCFLFRHLAATKGVDFRVIFSSKRVANLHFNIDSDINSDIDSDRGSRQDFQYLRTFAGIDFKLIRQSFSRKTLFVCVGWNHPTKLLILIIRRLFRMPYGFWTDSLKDSGRARSLKTTVLKSLKRWLLSKATFVLTTGEFGVDKMRQSAIFDDSKRLFSLPFFVPIPSSVKQAANIDRTNVRLLIMSRLIDRKGIDVAIEAVRLLGEQGIDATLKIAGEGPLRDELESMVQSKQLCDRVTFVGWADPDQTTQLRQEAHFALHPVTELDPYPLVVLESLAFGLPVIGTNVAGTVVDRVQDGANGFVIEPGDPQAIVDAVETSVSNPACYPDLVRRARIEAERWPGERASQMFSSILASTLEDFASADTTMKEPTP